MRNYPLSICYRLGIPPTIWMIHNPIKIYEYLEVTGSVQLGPGDTVLDLGCGQGIWTMDLARKCGKTIGIDVLAEAVNTANHYIRNSTLRKRLEFFAGDIEDLELPEGSVDHVFSFCVLEHIPELDRTLEAVKRLLRPGGGLHISVDSLGTIEDQPLLEKHKNDHKVYQYFSPRTLSEYLKKAGFRIDTVKPILRGALAREEFIKRIQGSSYRYGWTKRKALVNQLRGEDIKEETEKGIMIVANATCS